MSSTPYVNYDTALKEALIYFKGDDLAATTWLNKYALQPIPGAFLETTPNQMHYRLAKEFAKIERKYGASENPHKPEISAKLSEYGRERKFLTSERIFDLFDEFKYIIPQGSVMSQLGASHIGSLSNCFFIGQPEDSYGGIMQKDQELVQLMKRRGGVGIDISTLRPEGTNTSNAAKSSTGAVSFMHRFSNSTREVAQCIEENQRVLTQNGLKAIKDITIGEMVWTKKGFIEVINVLNNGKKEVYKTITKFGNEILTTQKHVFLTSNSEGSLEDRLENLREGSPICLLNGVRIKKELLQLITPIFKKATRKIANKFGEYGYMEHNRYIHNNIPTKLDIRLAYIVGYASGDGYTDKSNLSVAVNTTDEDILEKIIRFNPFKADSSIIMGDGCYKINICNSSGLHFLNHHHLNKPKTEYLRIPNLIWESSYEIQASYLSGLFDADGYASGRKRGYVFSTVVKKFAQDISKMLLANGILAKIHIETDRGENWQDMYTVVIVGAVNQKRFLDFMQESLKVQKVKWVSSLDKHKSPYTSCELGIKYNNLSYIPSCNQLMSINCLDKYEGYTDGILTQDYIETKEYVGQVSTYDLALASEHLFWCEGFYVHNSGRRGALMISIEVKHPDIMEFIKIKRDLSQVTGANISIKLNDEFMQAVAKNEDYFLRFPCTQDINYVGTREVDDYNELDYCDNDLGERIFVKKIRAKEYWNEIIKSAHSVAEPGLLFWDNTLNYGPDAVYDKLRPLGVNPCGEITLSESDSCRLIAVNLFSFVINPFTPESYFDHQKFYEINYEAMRLSDDLVDLEFEAVNAIIDKIKSDPESETTKQVELNLWEKILAMGKLGRRTGLGFTGLGDALAALGVVYGSSPALLETERIMRTKMESELDCTTDMAITRGPFEAYSGYSEFYIDEESLDLIGKNDFYKFLAKEFPERAEKMYAFGRRNGSWSTAAPTGSLSMLAQTSSGIEPVYLVSHTRRVKVNPSNKKSRVDFIDASGDSWTEYQVLHPKFKDWVLKQPQKKGFVWTDVTKEQIQDWFKDSPWFGATAEEINWADRVETQATIQKYITHSISSTINLPKDVSESEVSNIYMKAWKKGLKGITVYRDGSRSGVLIGEKTPELTKFNDTHAPSRPKKVDATVIRFNNNKEKWVAFIGLIDGKPYEIFTGRLSNIGLPGAVDFGQIEKVKKDGKKRYDFTYDGGVIEGISHISSRDYWNYGKLISGILRHGMPLPYVVDTINNLEFDGDHINTWKNGMMRALKRFIKDGEAAGDKKCPSCGDPDGLMYEEGCLKCKSCDYGKCG